MIKYVNKKLYRAFSRQAKILALLRVNSKAEEKRKVDKLKIMNYIF